MGMRTSIRAVALAAAILALAGCAQAVPVTPAEDATNPVCAEVMVRLPDVVAGLEERETNAQASAAWGDPAALILRCGVPVPDPTAELSCVTIEGVDWLRDGSNDPNYLFITYGRDPAVEVFVDSDASFDGAKVSGLAALTDVANAVRQIPATRACISPEDIEQ